MLALVTRPGADGTTHVAEIERPRVAAEEMPARVLEVGVCGTDREIAHGLFGVPPAGESELVLGHELLGVVERDGHGFTRGDLVTATVRRACSHCLACLEGSPDSCLTGDYDERGITRLHGFARELVGEDPRELIAIPPSLRRVGVLAEPASVCARAIRHARTIGGRQPWEPERALVLGAGAVGTLAASTASTSGRPPSGDAQAMADAVGMLRRSGVACLLGIDPRPRTVTLDGPVLGLDAILGNRVAFGSVNARRRDVHPAVEALDRARGRWPDAVDALVGLRVPLDRFDDAFARPGIKATLVVSDNP